jgi:hypothetical protein
MGVMLSVGVLGACSVNGDYSTDLCKHTSSGILLGVKSSARCRTETISRYREFLFQLPQATPVKRTPSRLRIRGGLALNHA